MRARRGRLDPRFTSWPHPVVRRAGWFHFQWALRDGYCGRFVIDWTSTRTHTGAVRAAARAHREAVGIGRYAGRQAPRPTVQVRTPQPMLAAVTFAAVRREQGVMS